MKKTKKEKYIEDYKVRSFRLSDKTFERIEKIKQRDKTWDLVYSEILDIIDYCKKL